MLENMSIMISGQNFRSSGAPILLVGFPPLLDPIHLHIMPHGDWPKFQFDRLVHII